MDFLKTFPYRVLINLDSRPDRLESSSLRLSDAGITFERLSAFDASKYSRPGSFQSVKRRCCSMSFRMAMRKAEQLGHPSVLCFEDDVVLHPSFLEEVEMIDLPDDWEVFYFGAFHVERPRPSSDGVVRTSKSYGCHCVAFNARAFRKIRRGVRHKRMDGKRIMNNDERITDLGLKTYACYPNLAWQEFGYSNLCEETYSVYDAMGRQIKFKNVVEGLEWE